MNTRQKHWLFFSITAIGAIVVVNLAILLMWSDMTEEERVFGRQIFSRVVTYGTLAMIVLFFISSQFILYIFKNYISPIETLTEETRLIALANAKYRIKPVGALETHKLTSEINELADAYISLKSEVKYIVTESKEGFEDEKLRLQTLMEMIPAGVIICNHDGRMLSCNHLAYEIFNSVIHNEVGRFSRLGLGQSVFSVFNRTAVVYGIEQLQTNLLNDSTSNTFRFITTRYKAQFLDVKIAQIISENHSQMASDYIFIFKDITNNILKDKFDLYANQYILLDEIASLVIMKTNNEYNFITESGIWLNISNYSIVELLVELAAYLKTFNVKTISIGISENNLLQINWSGEPFKFEPKNQKLEQLIEEQSINNKHAQIKLNVEIYKQKNEWKIKEERESRPVYYNNSLFDQSAQSNELDSLLLRDLAFVVFDTETTGLDPSGGDEIISIAGVRVFNGKINNDELFDELVNPKRTIPLTSLKIHEIYPDMLEGKQTIDKVLPQFHEFSKGAILVAHNAAFDMKFIQLKEEKSGVKFNNPVLDTLLLSAICNPKQELHNIEDVAEKCGVEITGRHTALGDAMVTAEIFLKLIPILESMGIKTLGEAREASQKTTLSKIRF